MSPDLKPLCPDIETLLAAERSVPEEQPDPLMKERVRARVLGTVGAMAGIALVGQASTAGKTVALGKVAFASQALVAKLTVGVLIAGGIVGLQTVVSRTMRMKERVEQAQLRSASPPSSVREKPAAVPYDFRAAAIAPPPARPAHVNRARQNDLAEEHLLLETASGQLREHLIGPALNTLARHEQRFPRGQLGEERDSLRVRALAISGDLAAARVRAEEFCRRYPRSLFISAVKAAVQPIR